MKEQSVIISLFKDLKDKMGTPLIVITFLQIIALLLLVVADFPWRYRLYHFYGKPAIFYIIPSIVLFITSIFFARSKTQVLVSLLACLVMIMIFFAARDDIILFYFGTHHRKISCSVIFVCMIFIIIGQMIVSIYKHSKE